MCRKLHCQKVFRMKTISYKIQDNPWMTRGWWRQGINRYLAHFKNAFPPRTTVGPYAHAYRRVLGFGQFLMSEVPLYLGQLVLVQSFQEGAQRGSAYISEFIVCVQLIPLHAEVPLSPTCEGV